MILSDRDIRRALTTGHIKIENMAEDAMQPASVDLHLSEEHPLMIVRPAHVPGVDVIDPRVDVAPRMRPLRFHPDKGCWTLAPHMFAIASTVERVSIGAGHVGRLEGKSSLARLGLTVHITAGFFDPGFEGYPTLELYNNTDFPFMLLPGMPVCQMAFEQMLSRSTHPYSGKYTDQGAAPQPSRYHLNFAR